MPSQSFTKIESCSVTSADGTQIHADAIGNRSPEFPVIVLIHGFCMVGAAFDPMFDDPQWTSNAFLVCFHSESSIIRTENMAFVRFVTTSVGMERVGSP